MKRFKAVFCLVFAAVLLSACSLFNNDGKENIDPPQKVSYEDDIDVTKENAGGKDGQSPEIIHTELYLIDKNGYVVPKNVELPNTESAAKQALEYLVVDGPVTELLPDDFRAVLPPGTEMTVDIKDGTAIVDFSKEFGDYAPEDEIRVLQSVTWTLTQFDTIDRVKLMLNGNELKEMPVNGTPINGELTREDGINIDTDDAVDILNTYPVTVYYVGQTDGETYYVPVTKRVSKEKKDKITAAVEELIKGPNVTTPLYTLFMDDVKLLDKPEVKDGIVTLNFNENIYGSYEQKLISREVLDTLVLSLTELEDIKGVSIHVNGKQDVLNQDGNPLDEPVMRPAKVNTGSL